MRSSARSLLPLPHRRSSWYLLAVLFSASLAATSAAGQTQTPTETPTPTPVPQGEDAKAKAERDKKREEQRKKEEQGEQPAGPNRPYRAVFGGASTVPDLTKTLDFVGNVAESYDQNLLADVAGPENALNAHQSGFFTHLAGDLTFNRRASRLDVALNAGAAARYYTDLTKFFASDYHAGAGVGGRFSRRTHGNASQSFSYAPTYLYGLFAPIFDAGLGQGRPPSTDYAVNDDRSYTSISNGELTHGLGPRSNIAVNGNLRLTHYVVTTTTRGTGFREQSAASVYTHGLNRDLSLRLGYTYHSATYDRVLVALVPYEHNFDVGIDFNRVLSETRRTSFSIRTGTVIAHLPVEAGVVEIPSQRQVRLVADGSLVHQFGHTWQLAGVYRRGTGFVEGLTVPAFTDAWSVTTTGFFSPRADFLGSVSYSTGDAMRVGADVGFKSLTGNARVRFAINQRWAWTNEYIYYYYDFSRAIVLLPGTSPRSNRNLFRTGISLWVPMIRR